MANQMTPYRDYDREMASMRRLMDRFFGDSLMRPWAQAEEMSHPIDVRTEGNDYIVHMNVPGFKPEDLHIEVMGDTVTVRGETQQEQKTEGDDYMWQERHHGRFSRSITLPTQLDPDKCEADVDDGVLTLRVPQAESARPKAISVKARESNGHAPHNQSQGQSGAPAHEQPEQEGSTRSRRK